MYDHQILADEQNCLIFAYRNRICLLHLWCPFSVVLMHCPLCAIDICLVSTSFIYCPMVMKLGQKCIPILSWPRFTNWVTRVQIMEKFLNTTFICTLFIKLDQNICLPSEIWFWSITIIHEFPWYSCSILHCLPATANIQLKAWCW